MRLGWLLLAGFSVLLFCWGCQEQAAVPPITVPQQLLRQPQQQQAGRQLFLRHCRECHGTLAEGRTPRASRFVPPAPDFRSPDSSRLDPAYLFWRIAQGKRVEPFRSQGSVMPAWEAYFTTEQIWQLVAYLRQRARGQ